MAVRCPPAVPGLINLGTEQKASSSHQHSFNYWLWPLLTPRSSQSPLCLPTSLPTSVFASSVSSEHSHWGLLTPRDPGCHTSAQSPPACRKCHNPQMLSGSWAASPCHPSHLSPLAHSAPVHLGPLLLQVHWAVWFLSTCWLPPHLWSRHADIHTASSLL
jgi:hypothetical protein